MTRSCWPRQDERLLACSGKRDMLVASCHHFPLQQRILIADEYKLVVSPESMNELYDRRRDRFELVNVYTDPGYESIRKDLATRLHRLLSERGDTAFANWMLAVTDFDVPMTPISHSDYDSVVG